MSIAGAIVHVQQVRLMSEWRLVGGVGGGGREVRACVCTSVITLASLLNPEPNCHIVFVVVFILCLFVFFVIADQCIIFPLLARCCRRN